MLINPFALMKMNKKLIRITTVPISLKVLLRHQLRFMSDYFEVLAVSSPGKVLEEVQQQEGVPAVPVNMTRSITPTSDLKALWKLYRLFKKEKPAIVHTHTPKAGLLGMLAGRMAGVPIRMHTVAGLPLMESRGIKRKVLEATEKLTYSCATKVYPNSSNLAEFIFSNRFCGRSKVKVLGNGSSNGIDTEFFKSNPDIISKGAELRKQLNLSESDFVFVFVGRLVKDKGINELIEAFSSVRKSFSNARLLLVGPFEEDLDPLADSTKRTIEADASIIQVGFQQDVRPFLAISDALTFPSYREGFPNVPMQAGCFDLPSIVTDINGCNEIIEHGKNGLIIPSKNSDALESAMRTLISDSQLYQSMKSVARQMIVDRYEQKRLWTLLLEEYNVQLKQHDVVS